MWTRICNLQFEGNLPPLRTRIESRNIHIVAKALLADRPSITKNKLRDDLNKHPEARRQNTYTAHVGNIIRKHNLQTELAALKEDSFADGFKPTPWTTDYAKFNFTNLPSNKDSCDRATLVAAATAAIRKVEINNPYVIYTDGTVDPATGTAGAAVSSANFSAC